AVLLHEVPQELGDFGVLLHAGLSKTKALLFNFLSATLAILGAVIAIVLNKYSSDISFFLIPLAAGGFIYIAGVDLIPELHKSNELKTSLMQLFGMILGIAVMLLLLVVV
ncbi:ZIP family metal transporter, partial [Candidatus Woesearchaeota archaeon]|nr:ZIP family metal transporter [Candidatus Woesearchaeota archaeon]